MYQPKPLKMVVVEQGSPQKHPVQAVSLFRSWSLHPVLRAILPSFRVEIVFLFNGTDLFDSYCRLDPAYLEYQTHSNSLHCQRTGTFSRSFGSIHLLSHCS